MRLLRFRVTNFRSVMDSGWVESDDATALIGTNEAGKTNLLLPLWKLNPANEGEIDTTADYPRKLFNDYRSLKSQPVFIAAVFRPDEWVLERLVKLTGAPLADLEEVQVERQFDGTRTFSFPRSAPVRSVSPNRMLAVLSSVAVDIGAVNPLKSELELRATIQAAIASVQASLGEGPVSRDALAQIRSILAETLPAEPLKTSVIVPRVNQALDEVSELIAEVSKPLPEQVDGVKAFLEKHLPKFVYYSNYGNLDSEIYLPHVIENLARTDLGTRDQAKARTLKVLFEFVKLKPQEILELGKDFEDTKQNRQPTAEEIDEINEKKKQRSILLQSASSSLTTRFRDWWKQGEYRFRFEADGKHFRIWVSDDKRPEEIELEGRSTGLQWFLSFYLVFLVESQDAHDGAILLLDEPGLSLHPLAQRDLSAFFDGLAETNQLIYTTHSPFLVDADHLDRARKVFVAKDGTTKATSDLRGGDSDPNQRGSNYAVHTALGISVAESLMVGCTPIVVEGPSDQFYLSAIKTVLISAGKLKPGRELVFAPAGGVKGVKALAGLLGSKDSDLPTVLVDSDEAGKKFARELRSSLYVGAKERVLEVDQFLKLNDAEVEDIIPVEVIAREVDRVFKGPEARFEDGAVAGQSLVPQIEAWATSNAVPLGTGWKVELARRTKAVLLARDSGKLSSETISLWTTLFDALSHKA